MGKMVPPMEELHHRHELTDEEWMILEPYLPPRLSGGRPRLDHRPIMNGILYLMATGVAWRDLPERYGHWQSVYSRFRLWVQTGVWERIIGAMQSELDHQGRINWAHFAIDGSNIRAHKAAAGARKKNKSL